MLGRSDNEILSHVRRAIRDLGEPRLTSRAYRLWRQRELARHDRPLPALHQLPQRYGSFSEAIQLADPSIRRRRLRLAGTARVAANKCVAGAPAPLREEPAARVPDSPADASVSLVAAMVQTLNDEELRELERFLRRRLAKAKSPSAQPRVKRLRPLAALLETDAAITKPFALIPRKTYDAMRSLDALTSDTLQRLYGSWVKACRAASGVKTDGRKAGPGMRGVPARGDRSGRGRAYSRDDIAAAIRCCADDVGRPLQELSSRDYHEWQMHRAARLRAQGQIPSLPGYGRIVKIFKDEASRAGTTIWSVAVRAAIS